MKYLRPNAVWEECFYTTTPEFKSIDNHVGVMDSNTGTLIATTGANSPIAEYGESLHIAKAIAQLPQMLDLLNEMYAKPNLISHNYRKKCHKILTKIEIGNSIIQPL